MATILQNIITIQQKETCTIPIDIYSSNGNSYTPTASDSIVFTVKESTASKKAIISKSITDQTLTLTASDTNITPGYYVYDIQLVGIDGYTDTIVTPTFFCSHGRRCPVTEY